MKDNLISINTDVKGFDWWGPSCVAPAITLRDWHARSENKKRQRKGRTRRRRIKKDREKEEDGDEENTVSCPDQRETVYYSSERHTISFRNIMSFVWTKHFMCIYARVYAGLLQVCSCPRLFSSIWVYRVSVVRISSSFCFFFLRSLKSLRHEKNFRFLLRKSFEISRLVVFK